MELRGRRVMTRLFTMAADLRASGVEPSVVELTQEDEDTLFASVEHTFAPAGVEAARAGRDTWRAFLTQWFSHTVKLSLVLDAETTSVR